MRSSRGSLESIGTAPSTCETVHSNQLGERFLKMNLNNGAAVQQQFHQHRQHAVNTSNCSQRSQSCSSRGDNWSKLSQEALEECTESSDVIGASPHSRRSAFGAACKQGGSPSGRTKGVPSFGYVKRANGTLGPTGQQNISMMGVGQIAHVSAVPRSGGGGGSRRVSGSGTQTLPHDANSKCLRIAVITRFTKFSFRNFNFRNFNFRNFNF